MSDKLNDIELSIIIPCLNEESGIGHCVSKCISALKKHQISGEVLVIDNGSTDNSVDVALRNGAKVIVEENRGYGNAYLRGFQEAKGDYIIIGDGDDTYDFDYLTVFYDKLKSGCEYVIGTRVGNIDTGAMPFLHRYLGNPIITILIRLIFGGSISDAYSGMRGIKKSLYNKLNLKSTGWEFALEMNIKVLKSKTEVCELPITYHTRKGNSKLNTFVDGLRSIRFILVLSPLKITVMPSLILIGLSLIQLIISTITKDKTTLISSVMFLILGSEMAYIGFYTKLYSVVNFFEKETPTFVNLFKIVNLKRALLVSLAIIIPSLILLFKTEHLYFLGITICCLEMIVHSITLSTLGIINKQA